MDLDHWHRVEYWAIRRGQRALVHAEEINDHGFYVGRTDQRLNQTTAKDYARALFEEFVAKRQPLVDPRWLVRVWRLTGCDGNKVSRVCEVEVKAGARREPELSSREPAAVATV
ncbi:hypothetical protein GCM10012275_29670 [Longimycelium tulufanense]|uniref:Uncharacterized protein n=1 Tax=Longimycelium tulufanense TaxID=907463 RepID=A0A8J3FUN7_9PSEU|nr:hypothetical protein [Longimycelium tulufanense]GGM56587.1 hypothetical protein GCM10012275_29670 [Longimycelium tulufanense]